MSFDVQINGLPELRQQLASFSDRRFLAMVATALTRTAVAARAALQAEAQRSLDKPTPYTLRQLRYVGATADRLAAVVGFNVAGIQDERGNVVRYEDLGPGSTPADKYLTPNIEGGARRFKRLEVALQAAGVLPSGWYAVPGEGAPRDAYGNVSRGLVVQILSQLRIQLVAGTNRNVGTDARKLIAAQRKAGGQFFAVRPGDRGARPPGIYQREFLGRSAAPIFVFVRGVTYRRRFDFFGVGQRVVREQLPEQIQRATAEHLQRMAASKGAK